jgi:hypothetical protein
MDAVGKVTVKGKIGKTGKKAVVIGKLREERFQSCLMPCF